MMQPRLLYTLKTWHIPRGKNLFTQKHLCCAISCAELSYYNFTQQTYATQNETQVSSVYLYNSLFVNFVIVSSTNQNTMPDTK